MRKVMMFLSLGGLLGLVAWLTPSTQKNEEAPAPVAKEAIEWLTLQQAEESNKKVQKPILIDLYTDWCGWCKVMDKQTIEEAAATVVDRVIDLCGLKIDSFRWGA